MTEDEEDEPASGPCIPRGPSESDESDSPDDPSGIDGSGDFDDSDDSAEFAKEEAGGKPEDFAGPGFSISLTNPPRKKYRLDGQDPTADESEAWTRDPPHRDQG